MSNTRHLDTALAILKAPKRKTRTGTIITVYDLGSTGASVQVNQKEVWLAPDMVAARADAARRKTALEALGRTCIVEEF